MSLTMGYAGVYSSFLEHARRARRTAIGVSGTEILRECGRRGLIGGQEDLIGEIAFQLSGRAPAVSGRTGREPPGGPSHAIPGNWYTSI